MRSLESPKCSQRSGMSRGLATEGDTSAPRLVESYLILRIRSNPFVPFNKMIVLYGYAKKGFLHCL